MIFKNIIVILLSVIILPLHIYAADDDHIGALISKFNQATVMIYYLNDKGVAITRGSGFIVTEDGIVVTANHVVRKEGKDGINEEKDKDGNITKSEVIYLDNLYCKFANEKQYKLSVLSDKELLKKVNKPYVNDYAILKIMDTSNRFEYFKMADYSSVRVGNKVLFAGFPFAKPNLTIHGGMISAKYSEFSFVDKKILVKLIQIDGSVNKGNSGGPVVDVGTGQIVGIISTKFIGISDKLFELRNQINELNTRGPKILFSGINPNIAIVDLIDTLDWTISVGIGQAISIDYAKEDIDFIKTKSNPKPKE